MILNFIIVGIVSYFLGSIPFTQIFSKKLYKKDLTQSGSKNVGARNFYEVTGNKIFGIIVLLLDLLKGSLAVLIGYYFNKSFDFALFTATFVVLGHNFSLFLKFKGGRGLATAAGTLILISPLSMLTWISSYFIFNFAVKDVHLRAILSTILVPIVVIASPMTYLVDFQLFKINFFLGQSFPFFVITLALVILLKHVEPLYDYLKGNKNY